MATDDPAACRAELRERLQEPLRRSCGSAVEAVGGKELSIGNAAVSRKHSNFIVAKPGATAEEVNQLIALLQQKVRDQFGIDLEPEVQLVGDFERQRL